MNITGQGTPAPARPPACLASLAHHPAHGHRHHHAQTRITSAQANPYFSAVLALIRGHPSVAFDATVAMIKACRRAPLLTTAARLSRQFTLLQYP